METRFKCVVGPVARAFSPLWALALGGCLTGRATFREITVERINVVDANGRTVMTLSNRQRIPGPVVEGKTFPVSVSDGRENLAGLVFFNQDGDEMGGLLFNSFRLADGRAAGIGHLSFDRFQDNQVLLLQYKENRAGVTAGLTRYDRPATGALRRSLDLIEESRGAPKEREAEIRRALAEMRAAGELGAERVFLGSKNQDAELTLKDSTGRVRIRLLVDREDDVRIEILDKEGRTTARLP